MLRELTAAVEGAISVVVGKEVNIKVKPPDSQSKVEDEVEEEDVVELEAATQENDENGHTEACVVVEEEGLEPLPQGILTADGADDALVVYYALVHLEARPIDQATPEQVPHRRRARLPLHLLERFLPLCF